MSGSIKVAGMDLGMVRDRSSLVIVEHYYDPEALLRSSADLSVSFERYRVIYDREWKPTDQPLRPTETLREMFAAARSFGCSVACADVHYRALVQETIPRSIHLIKFPSNANRIARVYQEIKYAFGKSEIDLSAASDKLIKQLLNTTARPTAGGGLSIEHARGSEGHGDSASAFVAGFYGARKALQSDRGWADEAFALRRFGRGEASGNAGNAEDPERDR